MPPLLGRELTLGANASVALDPRGEGFVASIPLTQLELLGDRPDERLQLACEAHGNGKPQ